jgi:hypothetical protein
MPYTNRSRFSSSLPFSFLCATIFIPHHGNRAIEPFEKKIIAIFYYEENYFIDIFVKTKL